jgi:hypothetical protein
VTQRLRIAAALLCVLLAAAPVSGVDIIVPGLDSLTLHGYYKSFLLYLDSSDPLLHDGVEDLNRARWMLEGRRGSFDFAVHYEHLATIHPLPFGSSLFLGSSTAGSRPGIWDLSWRITGHDDFVWRHEIDRLYVHTRQSWGDVTVGRQAIGWGVGLIWSPEDLFVAFSPVEIDREYRLGIDAARALLPLGPFSELEAVYAVYDQEFDQQSTALRYRATVGETGFDVGLMGGKFFSDAVAGAMLTGQVWGAGVHAEATLTNDYEGGRKRVGPQTFVRAVAGTDYRFPHEVRGVLEYYYNGFGSNDPADYARLATSPRLTRGELYNLGQHYLGFLADWEAHPLLHLLLQGQWNLVDPSALFGPALSLSLSDEAELDAGIYFALGAARDGLNLGSEFGSAPDTYYLTAKVYF